MSNPTFSEVELTKGKPFVCSDSFIRRILKRHLGWSRRRGTKAGQKVPKNAPKLLKEAYLRIALIIRDEDVLPQFFVNSDQTQVIYSAGQCLTWAETGAKQVSIIGMEEKRALTVMVGVCMDGTLLELQLIYQGATKVSLPRQNAPHYAEAQQLGFLFEPSKTNTYWSTHETMQSYVKKILHQEKP
jgi:hypothetical protein